MRRKIDKALVGVFSGVIPNYYRNLESHQKKGETFGAKIVLRFLHYHNRGILVVSVLVEVIKTFY
jgi:hypothetical protein